MNQAFFSPQAVKEDSLEVLKPVIGVFQGLENS